MYDWKSSLLYLAAVLFLFPACSNKRDDTYSGQSKAPAVVYISPDEGKTWNPFAIGLPDNATVSGFEAADNNIYAATDANGVFVYNKDKGQWISISNGLPDNIDINAIVMIENTLVIGTINKGIFITTDQGINWISPSINIEATPVRAFAKTDGRLFAGTDNGIYESTDKGYTWKHIYGNKQVNGFTILDKKIYAALSDGAIMSSNGGKNWHYIYDKNTLHDISNDGKYIFAMTLGAGLLKSDNDGQTWENANDDFKFYTFEVKNIRNSLFAAQWYGVYNSNDGGVRWSRLKGLPDSTAFTTLEVTDLGLLAGLGLRK